MEPQATHMRPGTDPSTARILAVFSLVITTLVLVVVIAGSIDGSGGGSSGRSSDGGHSSPGPREIYYVVQPGDTFVGIAREENVPIGRLERLNPNLDTQLIPQRACVNLVPEGCKKLAAGG
jgi:hypothetical protein